MDATTATPLTEPGPARLFSGPPRYQARTPWKPHWAVVATVLVFLGQIIGVFVATFGAEIIAISDGVEIPDQDFTSMASPIGLSLMLASQAASIIIVWLFAGWRRKRAEVLALDVPKPRWTTLLAGGALVLAVTGVVELVFYSGLGFDYKADTADVASGMMSPWWPLAVIMAVVLAPLWEELTFRGFLLPALAQTRLGFWGAALVTNTAWTALHGMYSVAGLVSVFTAGMVLSWLLWRTGSIRAPIVAHAITNIVAVTFAYLAATQG